LKKLLIIRFSSIGDIVLTTPVIRCLKKQVDDIEIHYLTKKMYAPILTSNLYISKVHLIEESISEVISDLRKEKFDYIIDLHKNIRSRSTIFRLRKPSNSFKKLNIRKWILVNFKMNTLPDIHIVERYLKAASKFNIKNDGKGLDYFIPENEEVDLAKVGNEFKKGFVGIVIGSKQNTKKIPQEKVIYLINRINKPILLMGGPEDREKAEHMIIIARKDNVESVCGPYSINQSASLVKQCDAIITSDTGLMHIAAAFKKTIFSVWGNTVPGFGMYPYLPSEYKNNSNIYEVKGLRCRPCSKLGYHDCPKKHFKCMMENDYDSIINEVNSL
jgi:ADP-heptose:LPS heptosyltransferase